MIVQGTGLLARAFFLHGDPTAPCLIFGRGVSDSSTTDEAAYARELETLQVALDEADDAGIPLVYFSGASIHGDVSLPFAEDRPVRPTSRYGRHQQDCEAAIGASRRAHLIARLPNAVGPGGHPHQLVPSLVRQVLAGEVAVRSGAERDLLDVADAVSIVQRLVRVGAVGVTVNVASGISLPVESIVASIAEILGATPVLRAEPNGDAQRFDISRLRSLLPDVAFEEGYPVGVLERYVPSIRT